jgi:hypothetical protein
MAKRKKEHGRIELPKGKTANERAKEKAVFPSETVTEARAGLIPSPETDALNVANNVCQNCLKTFREDQLAEITHGFWERVSPGEIIPSGECPECGALCHPIAEESKGDQFVGLVSRMKTEEEFGEDVPPSEDWISTLNDLIIQARQLQTK